MGGRAGLLRQIDALFNAGGLGHLPDAELLRRFAAGGGDAERSFEALVERHGPMVLAACRRFLRDPADAQDAFQATFLVLARKARRIAHPERLASWLYGVASRTAMKARVGIARRRKHERIRAGSVAEGHHPAHDDAEIHRVLHEEIARLPEKYRAPVVLCHLEGMTHERASAQLRCPVGTVDVRLMRARERLRAGLARRGFAVAAGGLALDLGAGSSPAGVPPGLASASARAGVAARQGWKAASGSASARAVGLARGVLTTMSWNRIAGLAGPVALLAGALALAARGEAPAAPAQVATAPPRAEQGATRWKKALPGNGWTIELVGVGRKPWEAGKAPDEPAWSTPDGRPLAAPADETMTIPPTSDFSNVRTVTFAFRVTLPGPEEDKDRPAAGMSLVLDHPGAEDNSGVAGFLGADRRDRDVCGFWASYMKGTRTATVRLGTAVGAWRTVATSDGKAPRPLVTDAGSALFSAARATRDGVALDVAYLPTEARAMRVVAIDSEGREIDSSRMQISNQVGRPGLIESEFPGPPGRVREFRLQDRPYEWAEFRDVALDPASPGAK